MSLMVGRFIATPSVPGLEQFRPPPNGRWSINPAAPSDHGRGDRSRGSAKPIQREFSDRRARAVRAGFASTWDDATMRLLLRLVINAVALMVAAWLLTGISVSGGSTSRNALTLLVVAAIFGVVNAIVKPVVTFVSIPFVILTLGLLLLVINGLMLLLTSWISGKIGVSFHVDGLWTAVLGAIILTVVSAVLNRLLPARRD
jgi:putative membrane protein